MAIAYGISSAGSHVYYAVETTAGTKPTALSAYTEIPEVTEIPAFGDDVNTLDNTSLAQDVSHTYTEGLRDSGGSFGLTVNDCDAFRTVWDAAVSASATGWADGKATWICITNKNWTNAFYFPGKPVALGFGGLSVDEIASNTANIIPMGAYEWTAAPTT